MGYFSAAGVFAASAFGAMAATRGEPSAFGPANLAFSALYGVGAAWFPLAGIGPFAGGLAEKAIYGSKGNFLGRGFDVGGLLGGLVTGYAAGPRVLAAEALGMAAGFGLGYRQGGFDVGLAWAGMGQFVGGFGFASGARAWQAGRVFARSHLGWGAKQQGRAFAGVQTGFMGWANRLLCRNIVAEFESGKDIPLASVNVHRSANAVFRLMGDLASATGNEVNLLRVGPGRGGLVLRMGSEASVSVRGATRSIAHVHPSGKLCLSDGDVTSGLALMQGSRDSKIVISPLGNWRRYQVQYILEGPFVGKILGGNF